VTRYTLTPRAQADLDEIWDYSFSQWGLDRAERYVLEIKAAIEHTAKNPRRGRSCDTLREGYRKRPVGSHVLFYRWLPEGVNVVRILHQRMDFEQHL